MTFFPQSSLNKSRNGRPETSPTISSSDVEFSELFNQNKENQDFHIYNQMLDLHGKPSSSETRKEVNKKDCKKKISGKEFSQLRYEYAELLSQYQKLAEENQKMSEKLNEKDEEIQSLKVERDRHMNFSKNNNSSNKIETQLMLKTEEMKQAKEYITELEAVVEKSKDNIIFLKDLVLSKDEKFKKSLKEIQFYKELSETHIAESSRLAKDLISIRSKYSKVTSKKK